jgi:Flp pilus assembly pilin Flp
VTVARRRARPDGGASAAEYALALAGVAGVVALGAVGLGDQINDSFECLTKQFQGSTNACSTDDSGDGGGVTDPGTGTGSGDSSSTAPTTLPTISPTPTSTATPTPTPTSPTTTTETPSP